LTAHFCAPEKGGPQLADPPPSAYSERLEALGGRWTAFRIGTQREGRAGPSALYGPPGAQKRPRCPAVASTRSPPKTRSEPVLIVTLNQIVCSLSRQAVPLVTADDFNLELRQAKVGDIVSPGWPSILQWSADVGASGPPRSASVAADELFASGKAPSIPGQSKARLRVLRASDPGRFAATSWWWTQSGQTGLRRLL
jgi:hypothetical protein